MTELASMLGLSICPMRIEATFEAVCVSIVQFKDRSLHKHSCTSSLIRYTSYGHGICLV